MKKLLLASILFAGCYSAKQPKPSVAPASPEVQADIEIERALVKSPQYTIAELSEGKKLYREYCGTCHALKQVNAYTEQAWKQLVPDMSKKVNQKEPLLDEEAQRKILNYVVAVSNASKQ